MHLRAFAFALIVLAALLHHSNCNTLKKDARGGPNRRKPTAAKTTIATTTTISSSIASTSTAIEDEDESANKNASERPDAETTFSRNSAAALSAKQEKDSDELQAVESKPQATETNATSGYTPSEVTPVQEEKCSAPTINDFPSDLFTQRQRRLGAIVFHLAFVAYLFVSIMRVCDDYFMSSLEIIGQKLNLDQDVAGATFMAAGSSAPEVFISLIGIFVSESNPGIGAIVGSAVFNILFVIGICGLFIVNTAKLTVWPFFRDSVFYCISILLLILLIRDNKVYWYESMAMLMLYCVYIFFMMNNDKLKNWTFEKFNKLQQETKNILPEGTGPAFHNKEYGFFSKKSLSKSQSGYNRFNEDDEMYAWGGTLDNIAVTSNVPDAVSYQNQNTGPKNSGIDYGMLLKADQCVASNTRLIDFDTAALHVMMDRRYFSPKTRFRMAVRRVIDEIHWIKRTTANQTGNNVDFNNFDCNPFNTSNYRMLLADMPNIQEPQGKTLFLKWLLFVPMKILFHFTIPDCRIQRYKKWYIATFIISIAWLAVLSYMIVWMITVIGYTLGIPDSLMAVTFIAAGTSIPDAYTSIIVVKEGMVDMGVSNIIGSNVFDLLIGLAFPWFIKSFFNQGYVTINSNGLGYDAMLLLACVIATICVIHFRKWHLDRRSGYVFLSIYVAFLIFSSAIELNLFSYVNPPMC